MSLIMHAKYKFKGQSDVIQYIGKRGSWHQFEKVGEWGVWAELLETDLWMIEEVLA